VNLPDIKYPSLVGKRRKGVGNEGDDAKKTRGFSCSKVGGEGKRESESTGKSRPSFLDRRPQKWVKIKYGLGNVRVIWG